MRRGLAVTLVAVGLAGVSVALGLIYMSFTEREGRWVQLTANARARGELVTESDLEPWLNHTRSYWALGFGTVGVAALGAGVMLGVFELRYFAAPDSGAATAS